MNLDFATEAAQRGCPYVLMSTIDGLEEQGEKPCFTIDGGDEQWSFMGEYAGEQISEHMLSRFACGATLALWWQRQSSKGVDDELCQQMFEASARFAMGDN